MGKVKKKAEDLRAPQPKPSSGQASSPATLPQSSTPPVDLRQAVEGNYATAWRILGGVLVPPSQTGQGQDPRGPNLLLKLPEERKRSEEGLKPKLSEKSGYVIDVKDGEVTIENTFSAGASFEVSLLPGLKAGPLAAFQNLEIEIAGESEGESLLPIGGTVLSTFQTSLALELLRLKIEKLGFSLERGLTAKGSVKEHYGPEHGRTGELGAEMTAKLGYTSPRRLHLGPLGTLGPSVTAEGTAGVTRSLGEAPGTTPSVGSEATKISAAFEAELKALLEGLPFSVGTVTLRVIGDAHAKFSLEAEPGETAYNVGGGGAIGLELKSQKVKTTLKLIGDVQESLAPKPGQKTSVNVVLEVEF